MTLHEAKSTLSLLTVLIALSFICFLELSVAITSQVSNQILKINPWLERTARYSSLSKCELWVIKQQCDCSFISNTIIVSSQFNSYLSVSVLVLPSQNLIKSYNLIPTERPGTALYLTTVYFSVLSRRIRWP